MARPSKYTQAVLESIVERLSGGEPMAQICRDDGMPAYRTVKDWIDGKPEVSAAIARARDEGFDAIAARLRETARGHGDSTADVQRDKLIIDTDLKLLAKWDPKRYGEKVAHELSGAVQVSKTVELTDEQLAVIAAGNVTNG
jgi:predicted DNA binding protein